MQTPHPHEFYILKTPNNIDHKIYNKKKKPLLGGLQSHCVQSQTPRTMRAVPNKAWAKRVSSPKSIPNTAVAAKVMALVTGTVREMGVWLRITKKVAEAERFMKKGMEYCQIERRVNQFLREESNLCWGDGVGVDLRAWSHKRAPRRMMALVAPHTRPTATIFSTSPIILFSLTHSGQSESYFYFTWNWKVDFDECFRNEMPSPRSDGWSDSFFKNMDFFFFFSFLITFYHRNKTLISS